MIRINAMRRLRMLNEYPNKNKTFSKIIAAVAVIAMLVAALYGSIIAIQYAEFNALDQHLVDETMSADKEVVE